MALSDYDEHWEHWVTVTPPADPRRAHHAQNRRWPVFERLCDEAETRSLDVELTVSSTVLDPRETTQHRLLNTILVMGDSFPLIGRSCQDRSIDDAASDLLERVIESDAPGADPYGDDNEHPIFGD